MPVKYTVWYITVTFNTSLFIFFITYHPVFWLATHATSINISPSDLSHAQFMPHTYFLDPHGMQYASDVPPRFRKYSLYTYNLYIDRSHCVMSIDINLDDDLSHFEHNDHILFPTCEAYPITTMHSFNPLCYQQCACRGHKGYGLIKSKYFPELRYTTPSHAVDIMDFVWYHVAWWYWVMQAHHRSICIVWYFDVSMLYLHALLPANF